MDGSRPKHKPLRMWKKLLTKVGEYQQIMNEILGKQSEGEKLPKISAKRSKKALMTELIIINHNSGIALPILIAGSSDRAALRFLKFFAANPRNRNTPAGSRLFSLVRRAGDW